MGAESPHGELKVPERDVELGSNPALSPGLETKQDKVRRHKEFCQAVKTALD